MSLYLVTAPSEEPLTLAEAKKQVNQTSPFTDDDTYITGLIPAARQRVEEVECALQLVTATYDLKLDYFPASGVIVIPKAPLLSVLGVYYTDDDGVEQTFGGSPVDQYSVDLKSPHCPKFGEIHLAYSESWPSHRSQHNAVRVRFTCGFGAASDVPAGIKAWLQIAVATMYAHRESEFIGSVISEMKFVDCLLDPFRAQGKRVH